MNVRQLGRRLIADHPWWSAAIILSIITFILISVIVDGNWFIVEILTPLLWPTMALSMWALKKTSFLTSMVQMAGYNSIGFLVNATGLAAILVIFKAGYSMAKTGLGRLGLKEILKKVNLADVIVQKASEREKTGWGKNFIILLGQWQPHRSVKYIIIFLLCCLPVPLPLASLCHFGIFYAESKSLPFKIWGPIGIAGSIVRAFLDALLAYGVGYKILNMIIN